MCGFLGYFSPSSELSTKSLVDSSRYIRFRGPDQTNIVFDNYSNLKSLKFPVNQEYSSRFAIVHSLLSIIGGVGSSSQPIICDNYIFAFNGSIYNYNDLRSKYLVDTHSANCQIQILSSSSNYI